MIAEAKIRISESEICNTSLACITKHARSKLIEYEGIDEAYWEITEFNVKTAIQEIGTTDLLCTVEYIIKARSEWEDLREVNERLRGGL